MAVSEWVRSADTWRLVGAAGLFVILLAVFMLPPLLAGRGPGLLLTLAITLPFVLPMTALGVALGVYVTLRDDDPADPIETVKERYASGEIDLAEYERQVGLLVDAETPAEAKRRLERTGTATAERTASATDPVRPVGRDPVDSRRDDRIGPLDGERSIGDLLGSFDEATGEFERRRDEDPSTDVA